MHSTQLIIEHCEPELSEWLKLEYRHAAQLWDKQIVFTNVCSSEHATWLSKLGKVYYDCAAVLLGAEKRVIVLDPAAKTPLRTEDFDSLEAIVVGGILGEKTLTFKTKSLITDKLMQNRNCETRNLGPIQLSIDISVFVAKAISLGMKLEELELTTEVEIVHPDGGSTILPFGYPVIDGKLIITPGLVEYLRTSRALSNKQP